MIAGTGEAPDDGAQRTRNVQRIEVALAKLPPRAQRVLRGRYWGDRTLEEVGAELSVSRERVRQLEADALKRLRRALN